MSIRVAIQLLHLKPCTTRTGYCFCCLFPIFSITICPPLIFHFLHIRAYEACFDSSCMSKLIFIGKFVVLQSVYCCTSTRDLFKDALLIGWRREKSAQHSAEFKPSVTRCVLYHCATTVTLPLEFLAHSRTDILLIILGGYSILGTKDCNFLLPLSKK